ncbi:peptidase inhibitor I78 family protein [Pseudomonas sp. KSR10]|uniref:I78 family peptidase inhibitor n=1 Tax=unclassified Pseudomonas TaxID=196821 RepID=UPI001EF85CB9|nr:I78 family peptidase inhibitor [Pseudomonas sp. KSR10]MCG6540069.1 peptidase inhibitor I78 family protein [Pseudomonas sp. KSR10]
MQAIRSITLMLYGAILLGCQSSTSDSMQTPQDTTGRCNAGAVQALVGKHASPALLEQARQQSGAAIARILRPGDVVTLEYNAQRLTLTTDESLEIQRIGCG